MLFGTKRRKLFMTEHGPQGGDEINILSIDELGKINFGWPIATYGELDLPDKRK